MRHRDEQKVTKAFEAALQIIGQQGIAGLKMQQLAKVSGMATGTLYIYFKDKNDLLNQMYLHYTRQMNRTIWGETRTTASYEERFRHKWYNYLRYVQQFPAEMVFLEQYHRSPFATKQTIEAGGNLLQPLLEIIEEGQKLGMLVKAPANLILANICGSVQEMVAWSEDGSLPPITDLTHLAWEMTWKAFQR